MSGPLLEEAASRNARFGGKAPVLLALLVGLGLGFGMGFVAGNGGTAQEPAINMAWQSVQARPAQTAQFGKAWPLMQQPPRAFAPAGPEPSLGAASGVQAMLPDRNRLGAGLRVSALPEPSALTGPSDPALTGSAMTDVRDAFRSSPAQQCVPVDKHASLCGNLVVFRPDSLVIRAESEGSKSTQTTDAKQILDDVLAKLDAIENKPLAALYAGGAVVALSVTNGLVGTIESIPLLPKLFELVGFGYSGWFAYRYLLKASTRKELVADIEDLKKKISDDY